jgi:hypothetical protein
MQNNRPQKRTAQGRILLIPRNLIEIGIIEMLPREGKLLRAAPKLLVFSLCHLMMQKAAFLDVSRPLRRP